MGTSGWTPPKPATFFSRPTCKPQTSARDVCNSCHLPQLKDEFEDVLAVLVPLA